MGIKSAVVILVFCLFMGVTAISLGVGVVFPSMNRIAQPVVCPSGSMDVERQVFRPYPGKTVTSMTWYCTDENGDKAQLSGFPIYLFAGTIYGFGLFVVVFGLISLRRRTA